MAIGEDRVQVTKVESTALGGKDGDAGIYGDSVPINPQEDAIESAGGYVQDSSNRDETVGWYREDGELKLKDTENPTGASITQMLAGGTAMDDLIVSRNTGQVLVSRNDGNVLVHR